MCLIEHNKNSPQGFAALDEVVYVSNPMLHFVYYLAIFFVQFFSPFFVGFFFPLLASNHSD